MYAFIAKTLKGECHDIKKKFNVDICQIVIQYEIKYDLTNGFRDITIEDEGLRRHKQFFFKNYEKLHDVTNLQFREEVPEVSRVLYRKY